MNHHLLDASVKNLLHQGIVISAHPLALNQHRKLDEERQRQLTRYYIASGAGGVAVGVHTTQFAIRRKGIDLLEPLLRITSEEIGRSSVQPMIKVAGIVGPTASAMKEAALAVKYGYHLGLVSLGGLTELSEADLVKHVTAIADIIPVFGFYLQPAVGGRILSFDFWSKLCEIKNLHAIKVAAFNRYQTLDVARAVCHSSRTNEIALYTGNDDNIVADLLTPYRFTVNGKEIQKRFVGGLLGHWAVWTSKAVALLDEVKKCITNNYQGAGELFVRGIQITDMNAAIFDAKNSFRGCIAGIHEVLRRQGLMEGRWCLDAEEDLSPGQLEEIDRIYKAYPDLVDDAFVQSFLQNKKKKPVPLSTKPTT